MIEPLNNVPVLRDLVVDMDKAYGFNAKAKVWQSSLSHNISLTHEDEKINELQSDCILCGSCYSVCPQGISSKADIKKLRMKSSQYGFMDPNFASFGEASFDGSPSF